MITWKKVAKPQSDQYDSHVIAQFLKKKYNWEKRIPSYGSSTMCDGKVAVIKDRFAKYVQDVNYDRSELKFSTNTEYPILNAYTLWNEKEYATAIDPYIRTWHNGHEMLKCFLDEFWPKWCMWISSGSTSGHYKMESGKDNGLLINAAFVSINNLQGCAQGIYHEVGHLRLEALGLDIEKHDNLLILNDASELYDSPVRLDKKRPMSAVIQGVYSWIFLTENDLQCAKIPNNIDASAMYLIKNLPKIEDGLKEIKAHVKTTSQGTAFMDGYFEWGEDVCSRARVLCKNFYGDEILSKYDVACNYKK